MADGRQAAPTREQAVKVVQVFGAINIVLGVYCLAGAAIAVARGPALPFTAIVKTAYALGLVLAVVVWAPAVASGIGLVTRVGWGRKLAVVWGRIVVWVLPIAFGLASGGLADFVSIRFSVIILVCFYANVMAANLARGEFDIAFVR